MKASEKMGPMEAVRQIVRGEPGLTRVQVVERALPIVSTEPEQARRTLSATILKLLNRGELLEEHSRLYYLEEEKGNEAG
jgi:hypothetical protein